jgi:hypothetical protein
MGISIDWESGVIFVPKDYTTLVQSSPTEIRDLDTNLFRLDLKALESSIDGMPFPKTHEHFPPTSVGGIELAMVVSITDDYTVTFENGPWAVNLKGSNNNILDRTNKNQVSVNPSNSAGLVTSSAIEYGEYGDKVTVDVNNVTGNASSGSVYPHGTLRNPVDNFLDATLIARSKGFSSIKIISDCSLDATADFNFFTIEGLSHIQTQLNIEASADVLGVTIKNVDLSGTLDGESEIHNCVLRNINYFNGHIHNCSLGGTIKLGGNSVSFIDDCSRLNGDILPIIDFNNESNDLTMPNYSGVVELKNMTNSNAEALIGLNMGIVKLNSSNVTNGRVHISGIGDLVDENNNEIKTGTWNGVEIINQTTSYFFNDIPNRIWDEQISDHLAEGSFGHYIKKKLLSLVNFIGLK